MENNRFHIAVIMVLIVCSLAALTPRLLPNLKDIGWDDFLYVNRGRSMAEGEMPAFFQNPLTALLYCLTYLPVHKSPYWLIHSATLGRLILFALLWIGCLLIAKRFSNRADPVVTAALVMLCPALSLIIENSSDALFAAMSAFGLYFALGFVTTKKINQLWAAALFVALSALARNDGLVLWSVFALWALALGRKNKTVVKTFAAVVLPFFVLVGGYMAMTALFTQQTMFGTGYRTYVAFEQGHGAVYQEKYTGANPYFEGVADARRLYGTPEENNHSVLRAIAKNPGEFGRRVWATTKKLPRQAFSVYGGKFGLLFAALALFGLGAFFKSKEFGALVLLAIWPAHLLVYFLTFFRLGYFLLPFFVILILAATGIGRLYKERIHFNPAPVAALIIAAVFMIFHANDFKWRQLGENADEKAGLVMSQSFDPDARIGSYTPGNIFFAKKTFVPMYNKLRWITTPDQFMRWVKKEKVSGIYLNESLRKFEPALWDIAKSLAGEELSVVFASEDDSIMVLAVKK